MLRILTLTATLLILTACASMGPQGSRIKVNLADMQMLESTVLEQRFAVKLRVQNRSQSALNINGMSFNIVLNEKDFASGVSNQELIIEPLSEALVAVDITSTLFDVIRQLTSLQELKNEPFRYELSGILHSGNKMFGKRFSENGKINLDKFVNQLNAK